MSSRSAAFALSAATTIMFNTALACAKDAWEPLKRWMGSVPGHDWTAQGIADLILFFGLGIVLIKTGSAGKIAPQRLVSLLVAAVIVSGAALFAWYAMF